MTRDQMARAGNYVLGLMDEGERARAERDLEIDPGFRDAVVRVAERMHLLDLKPAGAPQDFWKTIATRIDQLPQMRVARQPDPASVQEAEAAHAGVIVQSPVAKVRHVGLDSVPGPRAMAVAAGLIAACAVGYVAGIVTAGLW